MYKGVIVKLSGEELGADFNETVIDGITSGVMKVRGEGVRVGIVVGGGNFWRGRNAKLGMDKTRADAIGMTATVMNAIYLSDALAQKGAKTTVMTPFQFGAVTELFSKARAVERLDNGEILIFAGGTGHPFFSTDMIAAIRAGELDMDAVLYAKPVDGVYDKDPAKYDAVKYQKLTYDEIIEKNKDIKVIDLAAACMMRDLKLKGVVFKLSAPNSIYTAASANEQDIWKIGTIIE